MIPWWALIPAAVVGGIIGAVAVVIWSGFSDQDYEILPPGWRN